MSDYKYYRINSKVYKVEYTELGPRACYEKINGEDKINNDVLAEIMLDHDDEFVETNESEYSHQI